MSKHRLLSLILILVLCLACAPMTALTEDAPYEITLMLSTKGTTPRDMDQVIAKISEIAREKCNATIKGLYISSAQLAQQQNLMFASGEKLDLFYIADGMLAQYVANGAMYPLNDLLRQYGQGILGAVDPNYLDCTTFSGEIYAVPTIRDMAIGSGAILRADLVDKYGIDVSQITSNEKLEEAFDIVKAGEPDMYMIDSNSQATPLVWPTYDPLGDGYGVLMNHGDNFNVVNWYETDLYQELCEMARRWFEKGFIAPDSVSSSEGGLDRLKAGRLFCMPSKLKPGYDTQYSVASGYEMVATPAFAEPVCTSTQVNVIQWGIGSTTENPEATMKFFNLMYSDPDVVNLFDWGLEDLHYVVNPDTGLLQFPEGIDASNSGYNLSMGFAFGNQLISAVWSGDTPDLYQRLGEFNEAAVKSKALGFVFSTDNVKNEITAVTNVKNKYFTALDRGIADPAETIPMLLDELKAAGIDKIIAEKQRQLDIWVAAQAG